MSVRAFLDDHATALVHNLGHDCWQAAEEICRALETAGALPAGVGATDAFRVILSLRATLELMAVEHRFGTEAHDQVLAAMEAYYERTVLERGRFTTWIAAAHETMRRSPNPREWMRIHAMALLGTRDPEAATFHMALGYGYHAGTSLATAIAANVASEQAAEDHATNGGPA